MTAPAGTVEGPNSPTPVILKRVAASSCGPRIAWPLRRHLGSTLGHRSPNPLLLPPPHMFLADIPGTLVYFDNSNRVGAGGNGIGGLLLTNGIQPARVLLGLSIGFVLGVTTGALIHYVPILRKLLDADPSHSRPSPRSPGSPSRSSCSGSATCRPSSSSSSPSISRSSSAPSRKISER